MRRFSFSLFTITSVVTLLLAVLLPAFAPVAVQGSGLERQAANVAEPVSWIDAQQSGDIVYFLFSAAPRLERYAVSTRSWLSPLPLDAAPTAFTVDTGGLYVAFGRSVVRYALDGSNKQHMTNTDTDIHSLHTNERFLYVNYYSGYDGKVMSLDKQTGALIDNKSWTYAVLSGADIAPTRGKLYGRNQGLIPSLLVDLTLNPDGTLGYANSSNDGSNTGAARVYVSPDETRVIDSAGFVYNGVNLTPNSNLGGAFDDIAFYVDIPIVLRADRLYAYSNTFQPAGMYTPQHKPTSIFIQGDTLYSFYPQESGIGVEIIPMSSVTLLKPNQPVEPEGLPYTPDNILMGSDGLVYLLSGKHKSMFRWSVAEHRYLDTISLHDTAQYMAYSALTNRLYLAYFSGEITQIDLASSTSETPFVTLPNSTCGLETAGEWVFVCIPGPWYQHVTYAPDGKLISQQDFTYAAAEYAWSPSNRRMYFLDWMSPRDLHWEEIDQSGVFVGAGESPYHDSAGMENPVRVAPDAQYVLLGSGRMFNATSLERTNTLSNDIVDAGWLNNQLYTLRSLTGTIWQPILDHNIRGVALQRWGQQYELEAEKAIVGSGGRLFVTDQGFVVVTQFAGAPRFSIWDSDLNAMYDQPYHELFVPFASNWLW